MVEHATCERTRDGKIFARLRALLGAAEWRPLGDGVAWSLEGAEQQAWVEPAAPIEGEPSWRVQLRTRALEGFTASATQLETLSARASVPSLSALVRHVRLPRRLEMASSLLVRTGQLDADVARLAVAARAQAAEARCLSHSAEIASAGLTPGHGAVDDPAPCRPLDASELVADTPFPVGSFAWAKTQVWAAMLRARTDARAIVTPWGVSATFPWDGAGADRSILQVRPESQHPLLGPGLSIALTTPAAGGPMDAMQWNELEVGRQGGGDALGGWLSIADHLVHRSFHPDAFYGPGIGVEIVLSYARRAGEARARR